MIITIGLFFAGISLLLIAQELRKAPEGYEDEHGFHVVPKTAAGSRATKLHRTGPGHPPTQPATAH